MTTRTKMLLWICGILFLVLAFSHYGDYRESSAEKLLEPQIKELKAKIAEKEKAIAASEARLKDYKNKYILADAKLRAITKPQTITETKQRLTAMKYEVLPGENVTVTEESGKQIVVDLEKGKVCDEKLEACEQINIELETQKSDLQVISQKKDEQIKADEAIIEDQKKVIEDNKPSIWDDVLKVLGGMGIASLLFLIP